MAGAATYSIYSAREPSPSFYSLRSSCCPALANERPPCCPVKALPNATHQTLQVEGLEPGVGYRFQVAAASAEIESTVGTSALIHAARTPGRPSALQVRLARFGLHLSLDLGAHAVRRGKVTRPAV